MTVEIAILLGLVAAAMVLFSIERLPPDVIALGLLVALIVTRILPPARAFAGFGSDTVVLVGGLLVLTAAMVRTGVVEIASRAILRYTGQKPERLVLVVMIASAGMSAFVSNTACTAFFLPLVLGIADRMKISASRLLLPLAFSSILTSSVTLVSTSTNMVVSGLMTQHGLKPMSMFELSPVGVPIAAVGLIYLFWIGRKLITDRSTPAENLAIGMRSYLTEVMVLPGSPLVGKTLAESGLSRDFDLTVMRVIRGKDRYFAPQAGIRLEANDVVLVEGDRERILKIKDATGIDIKADVKLTDPDLQTEDMKLVEAILLPSSPLIGRTLKSSGFRERYGPQVLAVHRHGETIRSKISTVPLRVGDVLLVQGHRSNIAALGADHTFRILGEVSRTPTNAAKAPFAILAFAAALAASSLGILTPPVAFLAGSLLAFLTGCLTPQEAYREVEWRALVVIGCMLAMGAALESTGASSYLAARLLEALGDAQPVWLLSAFFAITVFLTQPMSNQAAAAVVLPVAIQAARQLSLNPRTFAMMVAVAASCSYLTPLEPSCLMVYGPGNYKFRDFLKVGLPLTALIYLVAILLVPVVWPLAAS